MARWRSLANLFNVRGYQAHKRLTESYRRVFLTGGASREDREIVLADLMNKCGWNQVLSEESTHEELATHNGKRMAFGFIFAHLAMENDDLRALEVAARHEALADQQTQFGGSQTNE